MTTSSWGVKAGAHQPTSEAFGETRMRSGTNMFSVFTVFSCVGSFWSHLDVVCSDSACEVGCQPSEPLDSLIGGVLANVCGAEYCACIGFLRTPSHHFFFSCFAVLA